MAEFMLPEQAPFEDLPMHLLSRVNNLHTLRPFIANDVAAHPLRLVCPHGDSMHAKHG